MTKLDKQNYREPRITDCCGSCLYIAYDECRDENFCGYACPGFYEPNAKVRHNGICDRYHRAGA